MSKDLVTKFFCETCNKQYEKCKCKVYMSAHRFGRTRPLPAHSRRGKRNTIGAQAQRGAA